MIRRDCWSPTGTCKSTERSSTEMNDFSIRLAGGLAAFAGRNHTRIHCHDTVTLLSFMKYSKFIIDSIGYEIAPVVVSSAELERRLEDLVSRACILRKDSSRR